MRTIIFLIYLFFISFSVSSQKFIITGKVSDFEKGQELPFANIMVLNHAIGTTSDENGYFELSLSTSLKNDTLVFSYVGYQPLRICINEIENKLIRLKPQVINLSEVVIKPANKISKKSIIVNRFNKGKCYVRHSPVDTATKQLWVPYRPEEPTIEAIYFPYKEEYELKNRIKEVWIYVTSYKLPAFFRLRIFNSTNNQSPVEDLFNVPLNIEVTQGKQLLKINLDEYNLFISDQGIFVGVELLIIPENVRTEEFEGNTFTLYSPYLNFFNSKETGCFWLYTKGKWIERNQKAPTFIGKDKNLFCKPAISLVLTEQQYVFQDF